MLIARIDLRPYIKNPSLYITDSLLTSLKEELCIYTNLAKTRPEYKKYISEIRKDIKDVKKWIKENPINIKDKEKKMYKEIFKLKKMLEDENIPFEWEAPHFDGYHLLYPKKENPICSVIEFYGSYGGHHDLLEIMGLMTDAEIVKEQDDVLGWLTAENVFNRIKRHWDMVQKEK